MPNHRAGRMSRLLWTIVQAAIVGGCLWIEAYVAAHEGRAPEIGLAFSIGLLLVVVFTIIPIAIVEGIKDVRRVYLPAFRRWRAEHRA